VIAAPVSAPPRWTRAAVREALTGLLFILPALLLLGVFVYRPLVETIQLSFVDWNMVRPRRIPVGLANYAELWASPTIRVALLNTAWYALWLVALVILLPLIAAAGLCYLRDGTRARLAALLFLPMVISLSIAAVLWLWVYNPITGLLGNAARALGVAPPNLLTDPATVLPALAVIVAWKAFGYNTMLLLAGLGSVPREAVDAARVDGAEGLALWRHILLPLIGPTILFVLVATLAMAAEYVFTPIHMLTGGGPNNASTNIVFEVWRQAFRFFRVGFAAAIAVLVFALFLALTLVQLRLGERLVSYEERG
jgi:sn-glycerol 3-phosphate transport system permease protein